MFLMTAQEIIRSMGYCCSLLTMYGVVHASCADDVSFECSMSSLVSLVFTVPVA